MRFASIRVNRDEFNPELPVHCAEETAQKSAISRILPDCASAVEQYGQLSGVLWEEENEILGHAVRSRHEEFAAGRTCARSALAALGIPASPILRGPGREPLWPDGIVGSITHCKGYCAAAVARRDHVISIGIDAEPNGPMPSGTLAIIARDEEIRFLQGLPMTGVCWDRLLFSAKESLYKAWYPLMKCWLGFEEVSMTIVPGEGAFHFAIEAKSTIHQGLSGFLACGRFFADRRYLYTAVTITSLD